MIKSKIQKIFLISILINIFSFGNQEKFVIRIQNPDEGLFFKYRAPQYDMPSYKPGEYLDLVVNSNLYEEIIGDGHSVSIIQTEAELRQNLRGVRDLYGYRNYEDVLTELQEIAEQYSDICQLVDLGDTWGKEYADDGENYYSNFYHEVWGLKVSDNVGIDEDEPGTFFMGMHHSREPISVEVVMGILYHLLNNYGTDPNITGIINNTQIWFVPIVNPNGHQIVTDEIDLWWRKNIRDNNENGQFDTSNDYGYGTDGVDPNRNYGFQYGEVGTSNSFNSPVYHGPNAWSEPENIAMKNLLESNHFVTGITYHSYSELVLFPFGYEMGVSAPDHDALEELAVEMAVTIPAQGGGHYTPQQSLELYPCMGTTDDYAYGVHTIFSFTIELGTQFIPPAGQIDQIVEENLEAAMILLNRVNRKSLTGHISDSESGDPITAEVYVEGIDNTGNYKFPSISDSSFGRYYRLLQVGEYEVTFSATGYESVTETVNISSFQQTELNVSLNPITLIPVNGQITDGITGLPIENASVYFNEGEVVNTDTEGYFTLPDVYGGVYSMHVESQNYSSVVIDVEISMNDSFISIQLFTYYTESFESVEFSEEWTTGGSADWYFDTESVYAGVYSVRSGEIDHNQSSDLALDLNVTAHGSVGFYFRVASEYSQSGNYFYDGLEFYINDELMGQYQPTTEGETPWNYVSFPVGTGQYTFTWSYVKDGGGGSTDMEEDCVWVDLVEFPPTQSNNPQVVTVSPGYSVDWNLVSLPISTDDNQADILFPNMVDNTLYSFNNEYIQEESLENGEGYWIRLLNDEAITFTGYESNELQINITEGWNLIGSLSLDIDFSESLYDPEEIILLPTLYGYNGGSYQFADYINAGYGYWIRSTADGEINLSNSPLNSERTTPNVSQYLNDFNSIQINGQMLYFGENIPKGQNLWYSLPPYFEALTNDIRFKNDSYVSENGGEIFIKNSDINNTIVYNIKEGETWQLKNNNTNFFKNIYDSGSLNILENISKFSLEKVVTTPEIVSVSSNFPNPFNNKTSFTVLLPREEIISINIYDINGKHVLTVMDGRKSAGTYSLSWNGLDETQSLVSSGTYFLLVTAGEFSKVTKIVFLK